MCVCDGLGTAELRSSGLASPVHSSLSRKSNASSGGGGPGMIPRTSSMHDLLEHRVAVRMQSMPASHADASTGGKIYRSGQSVCRSQLRRPRVRRRCKKRFLTFFFILVTFYVFSTFFSFSKRFFIFLKTLAQFRAASRLTRSTFKITATKFNGFINNRILYPVIRM